MRHGLKRLTKNLLLSSLLLTCLTSCAAQHGETASAHGEKTLVLKAGKKSFIGGKASILVQNYSVGANVVVWCASEGSTLFNLSIGQSETLCGISVKYLEDSESYLDRDEGHFKITW